VTPDVRSTLLTALASNTDDCAICGHQRNGDKHLGYSAMDMHHASASGPRPQGFGSARTWWHEPGHRSLVVDYVSPAGVREPVRLWFRETPPRRETIAPEEADASRKAGVL
jgi:hypothetical protein